MSSDRELWQLEERFWVDGVEFHERHLGAGALMVLPPPTGIVDRATALESIDTGNRWRKVDFDRRHSAFPGPDTAILAYCATADRGGPDSAYTALCCSTYVRQRDRWQLVLHQQTPLDERDRD